jgi:hypothetical protein
VAVVESAGLFLGKDHRSASPVGERFEHSSKLVLSA